MQSTINISKCKIRWLAFLLACVWLATHQAFASQLFGPPVLLTLAPGSSGPQSIALGDLNRDGNLDIVVASQNGILNVFLGNADGSFQSPTSYATGSMIAGIADCNGDGNPDVVTYVPANAVDVLLGNGDGTLQAPVNSYVPVNAFGAVVVGDLNGDGLPDVASTFFFQSPRTRDHEAWTFVSLGNGDGSFGSLRRVLITTDLNAGDLGIADFNGDGRLDLAVVAWSHGRVDILLGNGDGTFQKSGSFHIGLMQFQNIMAAADINGDGRLDLAVPTQGPLKVAYGNGDGTFPKPVSLNTSDSRNPKQVTVADFNGDDRADMVLAWGAADSIEVYLQTPTRTFKKQFYSGLVGPISVATGDLDHDGLADVVVADVDANDVAVFLTKSRQ